MNQDQLVSAVRDTAGVKTNDEAKDAILATLTVLGERLGGGETGDLAAQLPGEFKDCLPAEGAGERFGVGDFYARVAEHEAGDHSPQEARRHARAVMAALKNGITGEEFDQVAEQLPADYGDLLQTEPVQH